MNNGGFRDMKSFLTQKGIGMSGQKKAPSDFTLVELLIVIAIIAVLMSMLVPALNQARESAKAITCSNSLHQLGIIAQNYVNDHSGIFLIYNNDSGSWTEKPWPSKLVRSGYVAVAGFPVCPAGKPTKYEPTSFTNQGIYATYGVCEWPNINATNAALRSNDWMEQTNHGNTYAIKVFRSRRPSIQLFFADSINRKTTDLLFGKQYYILWRLADCSADSTAAPQLRHHKTARSLYADGHVEAIGQRGYRDFIGSSYLIVDGVGHETIVP